MITDKMIDDMKEVFGIGNYNDDDYLRVKIKEKLGV